MMSPIAISAIAFACIVGGALLGMLLRRTLPEHHLSMDSKDFVKLGMGLIATMAALVLGLLIASAKNSYDVQRNEFTQISAKIVFVDRLMAHYGPETKEARELLRRSVVRALDQMWPASRSRPAQLAPGAPSENFSAKIHNLSPQNDDQRSLKAQVLLMSSDISQTRWLMAEQAGSSSIPTPVLAVLVFWLTIIFVSFGLFAPTNPTVVATMLVCVLSVAGAIFLILELDRPFEGLIQISSAPLREALAHLGE